MTIDQLIETLPTTRRAKVRQRILSLIMEEKEHGGAISAANVILMKRIREKKRNGK